jgi:hypothetical protein
MARHALDRARWRIFAQHRSDREAVVADDAPRAACDVRLRCIGSLVRKRESLQEAIEVILSAVKQIGSIIDSELMDW